MIRVYLQGSSSHAYEEGQLNNRIPIPSWARVVADVSEPILEASSVLRSRDEPLGEGWEQVRPLRAPQNTVQCGLGLRRCLCSKTYR